ncbi:MAG TPA: hypothetical protein VHV26_15330 [Rhizomicrobium sp.]|jgi:hypothetical protein|nr:hypothetical protein [Rhizomicrobium sp.]
MMDLEPIIDSIYEAAFIPDSWCGVLDQICTVSASASGEFQTIDSLAPPRWRATDLTRDVLEKFIADGLWRACEHPAALLAREYPGFLCHDDFLTPEQLERDPVRRLLEPRGLGWLTGTIIPMPTGEIVSISFERRLESGRPDAKDFTALDTLRPHLARAGLISARLRLERAQNTVATLEAIGLAAAVLNATGRVLAVNSLLEKLPSIFLPLAHGRLAVSDADAQALFEDALAKMRCKLVTTVRSIPIAKREDQQPLILHLLPLVREAHAAFSGADILVVATALKASAMVPSPRLLNALFDLFCSPL